MDLESLRIFSSVASELSVTRAASRLGRAPSNVTTRIQQLEAELGVELFVRAGKRMALSTSGEQFVGYAQRILSLEDEARHVITGGATGGTLRIGSMESTAASRLPVPLAAFNRESPSTQLEVSTGPSGMLIEQVRSGQLDCAFVALPTAHSDEAHLNEMGLEGSAIWQEELLLLLPPTDATATSPAQVKTRALAAFRIGCTYRFIAEEQFGIHAGSGWKIQELGSYHAMVATVAAGSCVAILPESVLQLTSARDHLSTIRVCSISTYLVWRRDYKTPAFEKFALLFKGAA
ncbi:LysR family transcriptional regulator [Pseudomonas sp. MM211]|uniref:LysR substrate-binding domain-containing protein n=1 Tax=Pseudomonas sp. MM211 TaxID=2866808 RepID=UPI001CEC343A|nr:LysR substrate-binding domain-containing protein [Pseudomonas sp. MM211]UCJ16135.1 LysR family transcriptional regulator [Pseudomonas sp. MM211]